MTIYAEVKCPSCGGTSTWPMPKTDESELPTEILCDTCWRDQVRQLLDEDEQTNWEGV